ncbi:hypothetical protein NSQ26_13175 [Bacillus sp. FSL W7-1360]
MYLPYGEKTFEEVAFLYVERGVRYFCRMNLSPEKEMTMYQENGEWYCQTSGQEPIRVLLQLRHPEKEWHGFEINKREYLKRAIQYRLEVPHFVTLTNDSDIDESVIRRRE